MLNVLLISENPPSIYGGIERHCHNIQLLFKDDKDISIHSISKQQISHKTIRYINKIIFNRKELIKTIAESECSVVHIHGFASFAICQAIYAASKCKKKIIYTAHYHPFEKLERPLLGKLFFYFFLKPILYKVHTIICINQEDTTFFKRYHNNVRMIPNWLASPPETQLNYSSKKSNIILFVGRNDANKSPQYLYDIPSSYEVHCVTNSSHGLSPNFIYHYKITDEELEKLYKAADLLVVPSRYEAFSYAVLEALSQGTPVLISNNVRIADYLTGISGVTIFQYGNHIDFREKIPIALNQIVNAKQINEIFSPSKIKKELRNIYLL